MQIRTFYARRLEAYIPFLFSHVEYVSISINIKAKTHSLTITKSQEPLNGSR